MADHQRWSNSCSFIRGITQDNIPLSGNEEIDINIGRTVDYSVCDKYNHVFTSVFKQYNSSDNNSNEKTKLLEELKIIPSTNAAYTNFNINQIRLNSFEKWPHTTTKPTPEELSNAGFFYTGIDDQTICFQCGGELKNWKIGDTPWEEHARWFPKCSYVLLVKGEEFIEKASKRVIMKQLKKKEEKNNTTEISTKMCKLNIKEINNNTINNSQLCKICYANELGISFLPCGHIVACIQCAFSLTKCPMCQKKYTAIVKVYIS